MARNIFIVRLLVRLYDGDAQMKRQGQVIGIPQTPEPKLQYHKNLEKAHNLTERPRTEDVLIHDDLYFKDLLLSEATLKGLEASGFVKPSPIQRKAIPLGRCGFDLIVQAKSGTGKTCVFTVIALEMVNLESEKLQVLILTPTREISFQVKDVISSIGRSFRNLKLETFIGGLPFKDDKKKAQKCQIAVGTPGRVKHLISTGSMKLDAVRLFILDEADKLTEDSFRDDVSSIYLKLPEEKQIIAASATYPSGLENFVTRYMINPMTVSPGKDGFLLGIRQFVSIIPSHLTVVVQMRNKIKELCRILSSVSFKQCLVFSNYQSRAESICNKLNKEGWSAIHISGSQNQVLRLKAMSSLKEFHCRVLLSTDLTARGIDAENVNLIINLDLPYDGSTYMHRMGRAGRFGTHGIVITILQNGEEVQQFQEMLNKISCPDLKISIFPKENFDFDIWQTEDDLFEKFSAVNEQLSTVENEVENGDVNVGEKEVILDKVVEMSKQEALEKLFACQLKITSEPVISDYEDLVKASLQYEVNQEEMTSVKENQCHYEDYPLELKSSISYLEKETWKELTEKFQSRKVEIENKAESSIVSNENKFEKLSENSIDKEQSFDSEEKFSDVLESDLESDLSDSNKGNHFSNSCESDDSEDWAAEDLEEITVDSNYIKQWYFMWYSQLSAVRHYANYMKYLHYWNELKRSCGK